MADDIETHIADIQALYEPLIASSDSRLDGGSKLWRQFTDTVSTYRTRGRAAFAGVIERVNELAVARILLADPTLAGCRICYEPEIGDNPTKIDFVVPTPASGTIYVEVKTVRPTAQDSDENWKKYQKRRKLHPSNADYIVEKAWMGASIYANSFSARSKFMDHTRAFEARLSGALKAQPGRGVLVFCLSGLEWQVSELEDFADFYRNERHRQDDPFSDMEAAALEVERVPLQRNISAFGFTNRPMGCATEEEWIADVRGPVRFS